MWRSLAAAALPARPARAGLGRLGRRTLAHWEMVGLPRRFDVSQESPAPRSSHTVTPVAGRVAVFGGEDKARHPFDAQLHLLDRDGAWETSPVPAPAPCPVLGHGAAAVETQFFVHGGRTLHAGAGDGAAVLGGGCETDALLACDVATGAWRALQPTGPRPEARSYHCMTALGDDLYVFGGCGAAGRLNDLWRYSLARNAWTRLVAAGAEGSPAARGGSSLIALPGAGGDPDRLVLLYGFCGKQLADVHVFDLAAGRWQELTDAQSGDLPGPRSVFAAAPLGGSGVLLFGGEREESTLGHEGAGSFTADTYRLDLASVSWTRLHDGAPGDGPPARGWAGCAVLGGGSGGGEEVAVVFGGLDGSNERLGDAWALSL